MKTFRRNSPSVNAGSMADIAFLLLIFFLVTTTISADKGILRQLPEPCPVNENCIKPVSERNILRIMMNANNDILVNEDRIELLQLKDVIKKFIDNNGDASCKYCSGEGLSTASDRPTKAVISLSHHAETTYGDYVKVQDELTKAYYELRERYAKDKFNKSPSELTDDEIRILRKVYPFNLSEANIRGNN